MSLDASDLSLPADLEILRDRATAALARAGFKPSRTGSRSVPSRFS